MCVCVCVLKRERERERERESVCVCVLKRERERERERGRERDRQTDTEGGPVCLTVCPSVCVCVYLCEESFLPSEAKWLNLTGFVETFSCCGEICVGKGGSALSYTTAPRWRQRGAALAFTATPTGAHTN